MSVRTVPNDLRQVFSWALEIDGMDLALFTECDSPETEIEKAEFAMAGALHTIKQPGIRKFNDITFKKGMYLNRPDRQAYAWFIQGANTDDGTSMPSSVVKREVYLLHLDGAGATIDTFALIGAWISKLSYEKLTGGKSDFLFETGTICYDRYERRF